MIQEICRITRIRNVSNLPYLFISILSIAFINLIFIKSHHYIISDVNFAIFMYMYVSAIVFLLSIIANIAFVIWLIFESNFGYIRYSILLGYRFKRSKLLVLDTKKDSVFVNEENTYSLEFDNVKMYEYNYLNRIIIDKKIYDIVDNLPFNSEIIIYPIKGCIFNAEPISYISNEKRNINAETCLVTIKIVIVKTKKSEKLINKLKLAFSP